MEQKYIKELKKQHVPKTNNWKAIFQDVDIPEVAKLVFDSCEFDAEFEEVSVGEYFCFKIVIDY